jgi:hypothetical protein
MFLKKLDWNYKFGCIKRYKIVDKRTQKKKILTLLNKSMKNFYYFWDGKHNFYYIGVPGGETIKYRQHIILNPEKTNENFILIGLKDGMNQSSWEEISKFPDINAIGKKFA